jgi:hypothetical protein
MRMILRYVVACAAIMAVSTMLHANTIDFSSVPAGTQITNQYASQGVTFATEQSGVPPAIGWGNGLSNTPTGGYPTTNFLDIIFSGSGASNVSFTFCNFGPGNGSFFNAYSTGDILLQTGALDGDPYSDGFGLVTITGSNIGEIEIGNNAGVSDWEFSVQQVNFTSSSATPEPGTMLMFGTGVLGLLGAARRRFSR